MNDFLRRIAGAAALLLALVTGPAVAQAVKPAPLTILISIDGFRADYLQRGVTPSIAALAAEGVRATAMHPSYPSLTFPNHYTLVTGLRPDRSGIVDNNMEDPRKPGVAFSMGKVDISHDPFWWDEAEPLWVTAEKAGVRTATMFWPGSDLPIHGVQPHDWKMYDKKFLADQRVDLVLAWLDRPPAERPRFVTLYFDEVDSAGHAAGPDSQEVNAALARTDAAVGRLVAGLKAKGLFAEADLVIVADHGMAATAPERVTYLDDLLPADGWHAVSMGSEATIRPMPGHEEEVAEALLAPHPHMTCWRKADVPVRFHYGKNPRVPPFVCLGQTGWLIESHASVIGHPVGRGAHGFDPYDPLMDALFVAHGPAFKTGAVQPAFDNVDIYPLLAALIGVADRPNDGRLADLTSSLAQ
ncbi:ectonucleotide pyrophosphatase/phosphodiesterase [Phenylobacterium sp.]|jgi:predicted AlkP superfamily pyrophosphatase or phosphodiesterase|uniref:alkaline phosphatase family protein n=1 Tax=Phenylobacterium sp. TaxID=1871053 RepID=UPI002E320E04|nr:ectonucleotide pyrophosphatase/phosphodiesterase [Phenylobacterium sp.]HEX4709467.1 ectonucleotide pyrophosphatase/phosphodiesterase [Phenylobacterium sp.]